MKLSYKEHMNMMEGYRAFENLSAANAEAATVIDRDREYDQTAKTEACPVCLSANCPRPAASTETPAIIGTNADRSVSPAILEFRNQELDAENRDLKEKLRVATERITGFEKFYASFARKVDEFEMMFMNLTGSTAGDFAKRVDRAITKPICGLPLHDREFNWCSRPVNHGGPCSIGV